MELNIKDRIDNQTVTRITDKSIWLNDKRYSINTIQKILLTSKYQSFLSPDIFVDFTDKQSVLDYYNSFVLWSFGGYEYHNTPKHRVEVKNNLVFYNNEYYLPAIYRPSPSYTDQKNVEDGVYNVHLLKRHLGYRLTDKSDNSVNIFHILNRINTKPTTEDINKLVSRNKEIYGYLGNKSGISYEIDYGPQNVDEIYLSSISTLIKVNYTTYEDNILIDLPFSLLYGLEEKLLEPINEILKKVLIQKEYRIEDRDRYDRSFSYIVINESAASKIFRLIENKFKNYGKENV